MTVEQQKKVLILGGTRHLINYVYAFNSAGVYTIVADDMVGASAKKHADHSSSLSPSDVIALAELVKSEGITGVFADVSDITTWNAIALCKKTELPFYIPRDGFQSEAGKSALLDHCKIFGIKVEEQGETDFHMNAMPLELIGWPNNTKAIVSLVG